MNEIRIVYMGTPDFAVPPLQELHENNYKIVGVITAPDKPKGRGQKMSKSAVKEYAEGVGLNILQPTNLKDEAFLEELKSLRATLQVVVAFRMLPEVVWRMPSLGTFNLHASLLPDYRGAAPIHWAVINGEKETGLTTFFLKHQIDTGSIILQEKEPIMDDDTTGSLYQRLMHKGGKLVLKTVKQIENDTYKLKEQDSSKEFHHAPKLFKENTEINWAKSANEIYNFIRGLNPFPTAWTVLNGKKYKIHRSAIKNENSTASEAGAIDTDHKTYLNIQCGKGVLSIVELQQEGKKRMDITSFFRGNKL